MRGHDGAELPAPGPGVTGPLAVAGVGVSAAPERDAVHLLAWQSAPPRSPQQWFDLVAAGLRAVVAQGVWPAGPAVFALRPGQAAGAPAGAHLAGQLALTAVRVADTPVGPLTDGWEQLTAGTFAVLHVAPAQGLHVAEVGIDDVPPGWPGAASLLSALTASRAGQLEDVLYATLLAGGALPGSGDPVLRAVACPAEPLAAVCVVGRDGGVRHGEAVGDARELRDASVPALAVLLARLQRRT